MTQPNALPPNAPARPRPQMPWPAAWPVALLVAAIGLIVIVHPTATLVQRGAELVVYMLLAVIVLRHRLVWETVMRAGSVRLVLVGGLLFAAITAQLLKWTELTYPFLGWGMYAAVRPPRNFVRFRAELQSGKEVAYPFRVTSPIARAGIYKAAFDKHVFREALPPASDSAVSAERWRREIVAVSALHNRLRPADPIRSVRAILCTMRIDVTRIEDATTCRPIGAVAVTP